MAADPGRQGGGIGVAVAGNEVHDPGGLLAFLDRAADLRDLGGAGELGPGQLLQLLLQGRHVGLDGQCGTGCYYPGMTGGRETLGGAMKLQILQVPDCPNAAVLAARLAELAGASPDLAVAREIVTTAHDARRLGMTGSPTLLADGTDPFARPGQSPSISCRLYRDEQGRPIPAPSLGQLRAALHLLRGDGRP